MLSTSRKNAYSSVFFISAISFAQAVYVTLVLFSSYCLIFRSSQWLYTILTQPKVLASRIFCSSLGYVLNLYALFATISLPLFPLVFYVYILITSTIYYILSFVYYFIKYIILQLKYNIKWQQTQFISLEVGVFLLEKDKLFPKKKSTHLSRMLFSDLISVQILSTFIISDFGIFFKLQFLFWNHFSCNYF